MILFACIDILILLICLFGVCVAYRLWVTLGSKGMTTWFLGAMVYSVGLRVLSLMADIDVQWGLLDYTRVFALPLYLFLVIGMVGILNEVTKKMKGNGKKKK
jgi:ABC-type uncharacterized transport system permease subunit